MWIGLGLLGIALVFAWFNREKIAEEIMQALKEEWDKEKEDFFK